LFLFGLKAALQADSHSRNGSKPVEGLRAFARIYASRAYSARFVREQLYRQLGFETLDQLLRWWEDDHLAMDHHDLLCVLEMWVNADISANHLYQGDMNAALAAILHHKDVEVYALRKDGRDLGLLELDFRDPDNTELAFFGLSKELIGTGAGRWMMERALDLAFKRPIRRLFVHTCTLDSPQAVGFYIRSGFVPYGRAIEVMDDPRMNGPVRGDAAGHIPKI